MISTFVEPTDWVLEISPERETASWQQQQTYSTVWGRWNAYLNQLCLETILPWLKTEYFPTATVAIPPAAMSSLWDVVPGSVITVGNARIALIPTEAIDQSELEVPQEWVDIPSWAADYYLGVQVGCDAREIRLYGYATHRQLKTQGSYDPSDRTYCLDIEELNTDLNALWLTCDRYPATITRTAIAPIAPLSSDRVSALIDRLAHPSTVIPRLTIPFELWAALIEQPESRQRLYRQRQGQNGTSAITRLGNWFQGQIDAAWQSLDAVLLPTQIATAVRSNNRVNSTLVPNDIYRAKIYSLAAGEIALVIGISPIADTESRIGVQIHPAGGSSQLPGTIRLRLLTANGSEIGQASAAVTEIIQFQFRANAGEQFQIEIACTGQTWTESFELQAD
jgi:hypothetical protein